MKRMSQRQKKAHTHAYTHAHVASGAYPEGLQELELLLELLELLLLLDHAVKLRLDVTHRGLEIFRQLRQHSVWQHRQLLQSNTKGQAQECVCE